MSDFGGTPCNTGYLGMPGAAESNGFDLNVHALAGAHVKLSLALAYTDVRYSRTLTEAGTVTVRQGDAVGSLPHVVSPWNAAVSLQYTVALTGETTAEILAQDIFRSSNPGPFAQNDPSSAYYAPGSPPDPSTNLLNLRASLRRQHWDVAVFLNDALGSQPTLQSTNGEAGYPVFFATTFRPRSAGINTTFRF
jgi:hypothetical protein